MPYDRTLTGFDYAWRGSGSVSNHRAAWEDYWLAGAGQPSGCLPTGYAAIDEAQTLVWRAFALALPRSARVLDLATGDGVVLRKLQRHRRDLKLTGVDSARHLPRASPGLLLRGGVTMEALPMKPGSVGAVTSQFGLEYGDIDAVAREIARVLKPGGSVALITHRPDGSILTHNRGRRDGLHWVRDELGLIARGRASLALRGTGSAVPAVFQEVPARAATRFGDGSVAWELSTAVLDALTAGRDRSAVTVLAVLDELDARSANEVARIDALEAACRRVGDGDPIASALDRAGFGAVALSDLYEIGGSHAPAFGYHVTARLA